MGTLKPLSSTESEQKKETVVTSVNQRWTVDNLYNEQTDDWGCMKKVYFCLTKW